MRNRKAFTLAELLVVVVIIGILVGVSVPIYTSQKTKADAAVDAANVRAAKAAASAQYMTSGMSGKQTFYYDAVNGTAINQEDIGSAVIEGYGKSSEDLSDDGASGSPIQNGKAQYVTIQFDEDGIMSAMWGGNGLSSFLAFSYDVENGYNGGYHNGDNLIDDVIEQYGSLLGTTVSSIFNDSSVYQMKSTDTLYWRPKMVTVNGTKTMILFANSPSTGHASWQGYAFYCNGVTYVSTTLNKYNQSIDRNVINDQTIQDALNGTSTCWKALDE